jgi:hypothetical protein
MKAQHPDAINGRSDTFGVQARERVCIKSLTAAQAETGEVTNAERGYRLPASSEPGASTNA